MYNCEWIMYILSRHSRNILGITIRITVLYLTFSTVKYGFPPCRITDREKYTLAVSRRTLTTECLGPSLRHHGLFRSPRESNSRLLRPRVRDPLRVPASLICLVSQCGRSLPHEETSADISKNFDWLP